MIFGFCLTLWAYGWTSPAQSQLGDQAFIKKAKWLGPFTVVLGLCEIILNAGS